MLLRAITAIEQINRLTAFGLIATSLMVVFYALENRSALFVLGFAGACLLASAYGFLQGAWPLGIAEAVWAVIAARRWWARCWGAPEDVFAMGPGAPHLERPSYVGNFLVELGRMAPAVGGGHYAFAKPEGGCLGFVQFIIRSDCQIEIHRLWTLDVGKGNGTKMLRTLCDLADRHEVEIKLKVLPFGRKPYALSRGQLKAWYERHGFQGSGWKLLRKTATHKTAGDGPSLREDAAPGHVALE
jgi:hypothetical protein